MATYKVIQDVEAEDRLVGPLTLRQFIYTAIAAVAGWLAFIALTKGAAFMLVLLLPIMLLAGFLAAPWGGDQPTEIWAVAKLRFYLKPRRRIWDQSGTKESSPSPCQSISNGSSPMASTRRRCAVV